MILTGKHAVIYGVGDSLGGAVARAFAAAGAKVFLTARRLENAATVADEIRVAGGAAEAERVDSGPGVILSLTATPGGVGYPKVRGFGPAAPRSSRSRATSRPRWVRAACAS